jgi:hypothetical protein
VGTPISREPGRYLSDQGGQVVTENSFSSLLTDEIKQLTDLLPRSLKGGGAPVSSLLFQPTEGGGRLVYLDENVAAEEPIWMDPGPVSKEFFFDVKDTAPWEIAEPRVTRPLIKHYLQNDQSNRLELANHDRKRYPGLKFANEGIVKIDKYKMHHIFPSPVFHRAVDWWKRLPRLGQIYSYDGYLEHPNLLLICGIEVGNLALHIRSKSLLDHELVFTFPHRQKKSRITAYTLAASASINIEKVDDDEFLFLVAHLIIAHHWFFAYDPVALKLFAKLGVADKVLTSHGWPASGIEKHHVITTQEELPELITKLAQDLVFLIYSCARWENPDNPRAEPQDLLEALNKKIPVALALLCGTVEYATISTLNTLNFHSVPGADRSNLFMCIHPPKGLKAPGVELPLFSLDQLSSGSHPQTTTFQLSDQMLSVADAYIKTLCPVQPVYQTRRNNGRDLKKWEWHVMQVRRMRGDRALEKESMGKWLTGYVRARCLMKLHESSTPVAPTAPVATSGHTAT